MSLVPFPTYSPVVPGWSPVGPSPMAGPGIPMGPQLLSQLQLGPGGGNLPVPYRPPVSMAGGAGVGGSIPMAPGGPGVPGGAASGAASSTGRLSGLLGRTGQALGNLGSAGRTFTSGGGLRGAAQGLGFAGLKGSIGRATPGLAVASLGPSLVNAAPIGNQDTKDFLGNIVAGAGLGAAAGAPFAGVGAGPGALIGGTAGLAKSLFETFGGGGDDNKPDFKAQLALSAQQLGLNPTEYTTAFELLSQTATDPETGKKLGEESVANLLATQLLQDAQTQKQQSEMSQQMSAQRSGDQQFALAMQAQAQQFFTPYVNNIITAGQSQAELMTAQANDLPEPYRDVMLNQAQQAMSQSQRLAGAYAAQSAMLPSQYMMSQDLKRQEELARLQYQQSVIQQQSGGGQDFAALQQQLTGG